MIPYGRQQISEADIAAVCDVLRSDWLTQGPMVERFERAIADYCGAGFGVAVNSGTSALHLACLALGVRAGDQVWTSPITFVASANCARYCGAEVDFVDIDPETWNLDVPALEQKLKLAKRKGRLPKVLIPVHFAGQPCELEAIRRLSRQYGFYVIEDACHALGSRYRRQRIGGCAHSDLAILSFHPVKHITTGEGGMILGRDPALGKRLGQLRSHGITRDPAEMTESSPGPWYYQQLELGYNFRMTDLQAALGLSQLQRLDTFVQRRQWLAQRYQRALRGLPLTLPVSRPGTISAWHIYVVRLQLASLRPSRREVFEAMRAAGCGVQVHYIPVHLQPYYRKLGFRPGDFPHAEQYYEEALTLPLYPGLKAKAQDRVIAILRDVVQ
jgi:UDP-4-amino-4,6-dideoxy-N-acetyl-beta-L-altrosamine transaminase